MEIAPAFAPLIGHDKAKTLLTQAFCRERIAPAYLFSGPDGVGRSLAARCFAQLIFSQNDSPDSPGQTAPANPRAARMADRITQGNHPDLLWVAPTFLHQGKTYTAQQAEESGLKRKTAPQIRLSQIRDIARFVSRPPLEAPRSIVVIEQAETMAEAAANGLLKTLEEPGQASLILLAPSGESLLPTLVSRSQCLLFSALGEAELRQVLTQLGQTAPLDDPAILALAEGSPGRAIAQWQRLQDIPAEMKTALDAIPRWLTGGGSPRAALQLAAQITAELDLEGQVWLMNYLQCQLWQPGETGGPSRVAIAPYIQSLEDSRRMLLRYVQPLLVWEVLFLGWLGRAAPTGFATLAPHRREPF